MNEPKTERAKLTLAANREVIEAIEDAAYMLRTSSSVFGPATPEAIVALTGVILEHRRNKLIDHGLSL